MAAGQSIVPLKGDSIIISKTGDNAELVVRNDTKDSTNGVMVNIGNGVMKFKRIRAINDSQFVVGTDTITLPGSGEADLNFANADLVFDGSHTHDLAGNTLMIQPKGGFIQIGSSAADGGGTTLIFNQPNDSTQHTFAVGSNSQKMESSILGTPAYTATVSTFKNAENGSMPYIGLSSAGGLFMTNRELTAGGPLGIDSILPHRSTTTTGLFSLAVDTLTGQIVRIPAGSGSAPDDIIELSNADAPYKVLDDWSDPDESFIRGFDTTRYIKIDSSTAGVFKFVWDTAAARADGLLSGELTVGSGGGSSLLIQRVGLGLSHIRGDEDTTIYDFTTVYGAGLYAVKNTDSSNAVRADTLTGNPYALLTKANFYRIIKDSLIYGVPAGAHQNVQWNSYGAFGANNRFSFYPSQGTLSDTAKVWISGRSFRSPEPLATLTVVDSAANATVGIRIHNYSTGNSQVSMTYGSSITAPTNIFTMGIQPSIGFKITPSSNLSSSTSSAFAITHAGFFVIGGDQVASNAKLTIIRNITGTAIATPQIHVAKQFTAGTSFANGMGMVDTWQMYNSANVMEEAMQLGVVWSDVTSASEDAELVVYLDRASTTTEAFRITSLGKFVRPEITNGGVGIATLVGGTVTVNNTSVTANSRITLTVATPGGTQGHLSYSLSAGTSFTINSTSGTETSTVSWTLTN